MDPNLTAFIPLEPLEPDSPVLPIATPDLGMPGPGQPVDSPATGAPDYRQEIATLRQQGRWLELIEFCQTWSQQQPEQWEAWSALGEACMQVERWSDAVSAYRRSLELNPTLDWTYHYLSVALFQLRQWQDGLTYCQKLATLNPDFWQQHLQDVQVQQQYGNFLVQQRQWEAALAAYRRTLDLKPSLWEVWISLSKILQQLGRDSEAIATLRQGVQANPQAARLHYHLAEALLKANQAQLAVHSYRRAIELSPQLAGHPQLDALIAAQSAASPAVSLGKLADPTPAAVQRYRSSPDRVNQGSSTLQPIYDKVAEALRQRLRQHPFYPTPPLHLIGLSGNYTIPSYRDAGVFYGADIVQQCLLRRHSRVLEIGCGCGRIAQVLQPYLDSTGSYVGLDVHAPAIQWCDQHLALQNANFEFHQLSVANNYYYEPDNGQINRYDWSSLGDRQFDCIIALSVFNHLRQEDTVQYLETISQRLDPYGVAYLTFFTIDEDFFQFRQQTGLHPDITQAAPGLWYAPHYQPCFTGYEPAHLYSLFEQTGLTVLATSPGSWAQKPKARLYPDWFLVTSTRLS